MSEQIALGQSNLASTGGGDHTYDQRLFDQVISKLLHRHLHTTFSHILYMIFRQDQGLTSGFHGDDAYDLYDKPLFHDKVNSFSVKGLRR